MKGKTMRYIKDIPMLLIFGFYTNSVLLGVNGDDSPGIIKDLFEKEYRSYLEAKNEEVIQSYRSILGPRMAEHLGNIICMGNIVIPYLMEKAEEQIKGEEDPFITLPLSILTMKRFELSEWPKDSNRDSREKVRMYIKWWRTGKKETQQEFSRLYTEWAILMQQGKDDESRIKLRNIRNLGLAALPFIIEKISAGDRELVPLVSQLTESKVDPNVSIEQCLSWWEQNKEQWLIPFPNKQPIANAGKDQVVVSEATVLLDGSGSTDEDKDKLTYQWRQTAGPMVRLSDPRAMQPMFTAPKVDKQTDLVFELVVNDGSPKKQVHPACQSGQSQPDTVTITVKPSTN